MDGGLVCGLAVAKEVVMMGEGEGVNEGVDCGVKIAGRTVLYVPSYPTLLDVCFVRYGTGMRTVWSGVVQYRRASRASCGKARIARNWLGSNGLDHYWSGGLTSRTSHPPEPTSHAVIPLISSTAALCHWLELGWFD